MEAVSSSIGSGGNLTLHGQALGLPFREAFSQAARAPAAGPKDRDRAIGVDAVRATAVRDECPLPGELLETLLEVVDGHRQRARDVPGGVLPPPAACPGRRRRRTGRGGAAPFQSLSPALHETRRPQRLQVLGYVGDGEGGLLGERVDGPFALG